MRKAAGAVPSSRTLTLLQLADQDPNFFKQLKKLSRKTFFFIKASFLYFIRTCFAGKSWFFFIPISFMSQIKNKNEDAATTVFPDLFFFFLNTYQTHVEFQQTIAFSWTFMNPTDHCSLWLGDIALSLHLISIKLCLFLWSTVQSISLLLYIDRSSVGFDSVLSYSSEPLLIVMKLYYFIQEFDYCYADKICKTPQVFLHF